MADAGNKALLGEIERVLTRVRDALAEPDAAVQPLPASAIVKPVKHNDIVKAGGHRWQAHNGNKPHSLLIDADHYRFEIAKGDRASFDDGTRERSELMCVTRLPENKLVTYEYDFMLEPGPVHTREWVTLGQIHNSDPQNAAPGTDARNSIGVSSVLSTRIVVEGGKELLKFRADTSTASPQKQSPYQRFLGPGVPFERGRRYALLMEVIDNGGIDTAPFPASEGLQPYMGHDGRKGNYGKGTGLVRITLDGKVVVDMPGIPVGFVHSSRAKGGIGPYAKFGIYAGVAKGADTSLVAHYWNPRLTVAA